jgi:hypothetical protein
MTIKLSSVFVFAIQGIIEMFTQRCVTQIEIGLNIHGANTLLKRTGVSEAKCSFAIRII